MLLRDYVRRGRLVAVSQADSRGLPERALQGF